MRKIALTLTSFFLALLLRLYYKTLRVTFHISKKTKEALLDKERGSIVMVWHDSLALLPALRFVGLHKPTHILISNSRDGDLPSYVTHRFRGFTPLRVKASVRYQAVKEAVEVLEKQQAIFITPDGPRGPKHVIKEGSLFLAQTTGSSLFVFTWKGSRIKELSSWDRFRIPLPFSKVQATLIGPLPPEKEQITSAFGIISSVQ